LLIFGALAFMRRRTPVDEMSPPETTQHPTPFQEQGLADIIPTQQEFGSPQESLHTPQTLNEQAEGLPYITAQSQTNPPIEATPQVEIDNGLQRQDHTPSPESHEPSSHEDVWSDVSDDWNIREENNDGSS